MVEFVLMMNGSRAACGGHVLLLLLFGVPHGLSAQHEASNIAASPDGRYLAISWHDGELGWIDLHETGRLRICSSHLNGGFSWSRDSSSLVFLERLPGEPPLLWRFRPQSGRDPAPLLAGSDWKSSPGWLSSTELVLLSTRDYEHSNIWKVDIGDSSMSKLVDPGTDVTGLWVSPRAGEFVYRTNAAGISQLWFYRRGDEIETALDIEPLTRNNQTTDIAFSPSGERFAMLGARQGFPALIIYDPNDSTIVAELTLDDAPSGFTMTGEKRVVYSTENSLTLWRPGFFWGRNLKSLGGWRNLPLSQPTSIGDDLGASIAAGGVALTFPGANHLDDARAQVRDLEDLLSLAMSIEAAGRPADAVDLLDDSTQSPTRPEGQKSRFAAAQAWIERRRGDYRNADRRVTYAIEMNEQLTAPDEFARIALWNERLLLHLIERNDADGARALLSLAPGDARGAEMGLWCSALMGEKGAAALDAWRDIARNHRRGDWDATARSLLDATLRFAGDTDALLLHRQGVALLLQGDIDPLIEQLDPRRSITPENLLIHGQFQKAVIELAREDLTPAFTRQTLRGYLIGEWAQLGQLQAATEMTMLDLRDADGPALDYPEIIERYLHPEEQELWMERAVGDILLTDACADMLESTLESPREKLELLLARVKFALIEGDLEAVARDLPLAEKAAAAMRRTAGDRYPSWLQMLAHLFRAKYYERVESWDDALSQYDAALLEIELHPRDWGIAAYDLDWARSLVEVGQHDGDLLRTFLQLLRGLGDPLINPAHETATLGAARTNLKTLSQYANEPWLRPYLAYFNAMTLELGGDTWGAVGSFRGLAAGDAPPALRRRAMLEEAALRSLLQQHLLAADLLGELREACNTDAHRAVAIKYQAQAERAIGLVPSEEDRMRYLALSAGLSPQWMRVLIPPYPGAGSTPDEF